MSSPTEGSEVKLPSGKVDRERSDKPNCGASREEVTCAIGQDGVASGWHRYPLPDTSHQENLWHNV